jgi:hypothetical protein
VHQGHQGPLSRQRERILAGCVASADHHHPPAAKMRGVARRGLQQAAASEPVLAGDTEQAAAQAQRQYQRPRTQLQATGQAHPRQALLDAHLGDTTPQPADAPLGELPPQPGGQRGPAQRPQAEKVRHQAVHDVELASELRSGVDEQAGMTKTPAPERRGHARHAAAEHRHLLGIGELSRGHQRRALVRALRP